jgi:hypothetical protein
MSGKKTYIRPGMNVDCVLDVCEQERGLDVRRSQVYELDDAVMIISQTTPPILPSFKGRRIEVTCVNNNDDMRVGISGKISRIVDDYKLSSSERVGAVFLSSLTEEKQHNLRFAFRVRPPQAHKLILYNSQKETLEIVNISATGVRFSHDMTREYKVGQKINMYLGHEQVFYELKGRVVHKGFGRSERRNKIEYVSVQFLDLDYRVEEKLYKIVRKIELQKGSSILRVRGDASPKTI